MYVTNISALKTISTIPLNEEIVLGGYYNVGDNGGGTFLWKTGSPLPAEDGGIIIYHDTDSSGWFERNITEPYLNVRWFGAVGDGVTDDTQFLQNALDVLDNGYLRTLSFGTGTYGITAPLLLSTSGNLTCENAVIKVIQEFQHNQWGAISVFPKSGGPLETTVTIENLTIDGNGYFSAIPFTNPYGSGSAIGFTNDNIGIMIGGRLGDASPLFLVNATVRDCTIYNCCYGVKVDANKKSTTLQNNYIYDVGTAGIALLNAENCIVSTNKIHTVQGNFSLGTSLDDSKFADGVYTSALKDSVIENNTIYNAIRMGIAIETQIVKATNVSIKGNNIKNMHSCRGDQFNSAIWVEGLKSDENIIIEGNIVSNEIATPGSNASWGITANNGVSVFNNIVKYFDLGINGTSFIARGNAVSFCGEGITASPAEGETVILSNNIVKNNLGPGIHSQYPNGKLFIQQNVIEDNGTANDDESLRSSSGLYIAGPLNEHLVLAVDDNIFISSCEPFDDYGFQKAAIYLVSGHSPYDSYSTAFIRNNRFVFSRQNVYSEAVGTNPDPTLIPPTPPTPPPYYGHYPSSLAYDNTDGRPHYKEITCAQGNVNTKLLYVNSSAYNAEDSWFGFQRFQGQSGSAPTAGDFLKGDYMLNSSLSANGFIGWMCTADGNPGTWLPYGKIGMAAASPDTASVGSSYSQLDVESIIDELRDLKQKLIDANLLTP